MDNENKDTTGELGEVQPGKQNLGQALLQKTFMRLVNFELMAGDPIFGWRVRRLAPGIIRELVTILKHDIDDITLAKISNSKDLIEAREHIQRFIAKQGYWDIRSQEAVKVKNIINHIEDGPQDGFISFRGILIKEAVKQKALSEKRGDSKRSRDRTSKRSIDEFIEYIEEIKDEGLFGQELLDFIYNIILNIFVEEEAINVWMEIIDYIIEKQYHYPKALRKKKIVGKKKVMEEVVVA